MFLHNNLEEFQQLLTATASYYERPEVYIEKDYYAMQMLKTIVDRNPSLVFKGGTCLSKCHHVIDRFSEDIDLGIAEEHATEGMRKAIKRAVVESAEALDLSIANLDETRSRRDYNRYVLVLPNSEETLLIETAIMTPASPCKEYEVQSFIGEYCQENQLEDVVAEYGLASFKVLASSMERILCDKTFALCDYYLAGEPLRRHSRHIYDLKKLQERIPFDNELAELFTKVRLQRQGKPRCLSAEDTVRLSDALDELVANKVYREDYIGVTEDLLYEEMPYDEAIYVLSELASFLRAAGN